MSRNFELMMKAEKEVKTVGVPSGYTATNNGRSTRLDLDSRAREETNRLVQLVFPANARDSARIVVFCGVEHGDGCSQICACAGEALAAPGTGSVCLVDASFHRPSLSEYFGAENRRGLTDALVQQGPIREFAQELSQNNLWLMPRGSRSSDGQNLLGSGILRARMGELRTEFGYILVDAPPVNLSADAIALGQLADGVVLVIGAHSTKREAAQKAKENLEAANVRILGAVLNRRTFPIPEMLYRRIL